MAFGLNARLLNLDPTIAAHRDSRSWHNNISRRVRGQKKRSKPFVTALILHGANPWAGRVGPRSLLGVCVQQ